MLQENKIKFSDFVFYHFEEEVDKYFDWKGVNYKLIKSKSSKTFEYKFDSVDVLKIYAKEIIESKEYKENPYNFIIGLNNFKTDMFSGFLTGEEIYKKIKDEWKNFAKKCVWNYTILVNIDDVFYVIDNEIETRIHYPSENIKEDHIFNLLVMPNTYRHFVKFKYLNDEEKIKISPKTEVFRKLENYFVNNFYNCPCFGVNDILL